MKEQIHFGTDGWRAIIGEDFTEETLTLAVAASAKAFRALQAEQADLQEKNILLVGFDCRLNAGEYAQIAARVLRDFGFKVHVSDTYCPTPCLCWSVAQNKNALGGLMLTSSHNPAEYLGLKLRMSDGGASPQEFTNCVEASLDEADLQAEARKEWLSTFAKSYAFVPTNAEDLSIYKKDFVGPYLEALKSRVNVECIKNAQLKIALDPLYGAGRLYLAGLLEDMGVEVVEVNNQEDPSFNGLHPEPIEPWVCEGLKAVVEHKCDAGFITDGDADRIAAIDSRGRYVNPHRIILLLVNHLVRTKRQRGRVVSTLTASALLSRLCSELGIELTSTPVGFKWIYAQMLKGDVLIGGEESGGIGLPYHVMERDGLLMALLMVEAMAETGRHLEDLLDDIFTKIGVMEFERQGLQINNDQMARFREEILVDYSPECLVDTHVREINRADGIKIVLEDDSWLMMRPSGTEPLVRIYAEAETRDKVEALLNCAKEVILER